MLKRKHQSLFKTSNTRCNISFWSPWTPSPSSDLTLRAMVITKHTELHNSLAKMQIPVTGYHMQHHKLAIKQPCIQPSPAIPNRDAHIITIHLRIALPAIRLQSEGYLHNCDHRGRTDGRRPFLATLLFRSRIHANTTQRASHA